MTPASRVVTRGTLNRVSVHALVTSGVLDLVVAAFVGGVACLRIVARHDAVLTLRLC